jgi:P27 family predicted phage terminase small subunit
VSARGRKPKSALQVVREGNPGHRPIKDSVVLPPSALEEPAWAELFPGRSAEVMRARGTAASLWRKVAPTLARSAGLVGEQRETLVDYCVSWARIEQAERAVSRQGVVVETAKGNVRNPWTTVLNQYRAHFRSLVGELGLSPSAATRLRRPLDADGPDDPFD